jgi:hypothetical protein
VKEKLRPVILFTLKFAWPDVGATVKWVNVFGDRLSIKPDLLSI